MAATLRQRQKAADVLRADGSQAEAARAADVSLSTLKRWLHQPEFRAMINGSPEIRPGAPPRIDDKGKHEPLGDLRSRMWVVAETHEILGSHIPPAAWEDPGAVVHAHVVQQDAAEGIVDAIRAGVFPAESPYIPLLLAEWNALLDNLPFVCRLGSPDQRKSLLAFLEVWIFVDESGRNRTLGGSLWDGQQRFFEALLSDGHVLSVKARKVGLSTLVCAHAAWTARIRDPNASVQLLSHREDAARELLARLRVGFEGLPAFLRLPLERETLSMLCFAAGPGDTRMLKAFPATRNAAIEATSSHVVLDEWAHTSDPEALWGAVEPTLAPRATSALITTVRGPGDFVHRYYLRSEAGETRHTPVFVHVLERPDRSVDWLKRKRIEEGKVGGLRNYPLNADEAFASAGEPYFAPELLEAAHEDAMPPSPCRSGDRYVKAWDIGRKASVCIVLRAPSKDEEQVLDVVGYERLVDQDYPTIQAAIEAMHSTYPGPTVIEANSIGQAIIEFVRIPEHQLIAYTTTQPSKLEMLAKIEFHLQQKTLGIHQDFHQLHAELANYRSPDGSIIQDSVMALGIAVEHAGLASAAGSGHGINRELFHELNGGHRTPPSRWLDAQKITTDGPSYGLVPIIRDVSDPREISEYQADALTEELEEKLAKGWKVRDPETLERLGLCLGADGRIRTLEQISPH